MKTKVVKAKYYAETGDIIPLDPQPVRVQGLYSYARSGTDEAGEYVVIDFMTEEDVYFGYDAANQLTSQPLEINITEDEWNKPVENDTETMDMQNQGNAGNANPPTLQKSPTINLKMSPQTCLTVIGKSTPTIKQRFSNVWDAITSNFLR